MIQLILLFSNTSSSILPFPLLLLILSLIYLLTDKIKLLQILALPLYILYLMVLIRVKLLLLCYGEYTMTHLSHTSTITSMDITQKFPGQPTSKIKHSTNLNLTAQFLLIWMTHYGLHLHSKNSYKFSL